MVSPSTHPIIETRGLTKVFKDFWMRPRVKAVDNLDLQVMPHQVFGLLGPNGSGKSTTIKIILGLLFPTKGRVSVFGKLPTDVATKTRIGYLPEESYLYRFLNARETLDYYGRLFHIDRAKRIKRIDMLLEMVGLDAVQRRPVGEFSKGMQRRIGLAQALINDPDLLILDEPTTGLDPIGTRQIKDLILELRHRGKTVLLSSHLLADVEDVCDRVTILYGGKIRKQGTCDELLSDEGKTVIETESLKESTITKIDQLIQQEEGKAIRRCEAPRQKLEQLFLNIVHEAQAEGAATSGARAGGAVAEFLARDAHMPESVEGRDLINQLISDDEHKDDQPAAAKPQATRETPQDSVIDDLVKPSEPEPATTSDDQREQPKRDEPDRSVIDDLLGGGGKS
ncbi:ABC transporter ATP-binding protein [Planctomycetales bacterium ZRK34]|nr:ABC transporter ATP-binding protein [Planctomycetales bacterium ZRK34]